MFWGIMKHAKHMCHWVTLDASQCCNCCQGFDVNHCWFFIDFMSLFQFRRLEKSQDIFEQRNKQGIRVTGSESGAERWQKNC